MIAFVRSVTFAAASSTSRLSVAGIDLREDGSRAAPDDRLGGRVEGEGRADDLVAGADARVASSASTSASVPFATPIVRFTPRNAAASSWNAQ